MAKIFFIEIEKIKKRILSLSTLIEENVEKSIEAVHTRNSALAQEVIISDDTVDQQEVELEEECLKLMALYQPVAIDMRFLISVLKINNDLERVGDLAVNIAKKANYLAKHPEIDIVVDFTKMAAQTKQILRLSLDAFVNFDSNLAHQIWGMGDEIHFAKQNIATYLQENMNNEFEIADRFYSIGRNLDRIAEMAINIAEDTIYMIEGEIIRHQRSKNIEGFH